MSNEKPKVGLLPLYLKLYDDRERNKRPRIEAFYKQIAIELENRKVEVVTSPICRKRSEFEAGSSPPCPSRSSLASTAGSEAPITWPSATG